MFPWERLTCPGKSCHEVYDVMGFPYHGIILIRAGLESRDLIKSRGYLINEM